MKDKAFAAITSEGHRGVLESILPPDTLWLVSSNPNVRGQLAEWEAQNIDAVVVDDDGMPYKEVSEPDLYAYPATAARKMQIIFLPAAERSEDDPFLSRLVGVGIYDIVSPRLEAAEARAEIERMIERPSVLADALRYFDEEAARGHGARRKSRRRARQGPGVWRKMIGKKPDGRPPLFEGAAQGEPPAGEPPKGAGPGPRHALPPEGAPCGPRHALPPKGEGPASALSELRERVMGQGGGEEAGQGPGGREGAAPPQAAPPAQEAAPAPGRPPRPQGSAAPSAALERLLSEAAPSPEGPGGPERPAPSARPAAPGDMSEEQIEAVADAVYDRVIEKLDKLEGKAIMAIGQGTEGARAGGRPSGRCRTVSVAELRHGDGSTPTALALAFWIARRWPERKVACALADRAKLNALLPPESTDAGLQHKRVTIGMIGDPNLARADWLVADCGAVNPAAQGRAYTAYMTAGVKCMVVAAEPWDMHKVRKAAELHDAADRASWTWCFKGASEDFAASCMQLVVPEGKSRSAPFVLPYDPCYFFGASEADYYELVRPALPKPAKRGEGGKEQVEK